MSGESASVLQDLAVSSTDGAERQGKSPNLSPGPTGATGSVVNSGSLGSDVDRSAWPEWMKKQISLIEGSPVMAGKFRLVLKKFVELETLLGFPKGQVRCCERIAGNDHTDNLNRARTTSSTTRSVQRKLVDGSMAGEKGHPTFRTSHTMLQHGKLGGSPCSQVPGRNANYSVLLMLVRNGRSCGREVSMASSISSSVLSGDMLPSRIQHRARPIARQWRMFPGCWVGCWMMARMARSVPVAPPMRPRRRRGVSPHIDKVMITEIAQQGKSQMNIGKEVNGSVQHHITWIWCVYPSVSDWTCSTYSILFMIVLSVQCLTIP